VTIDPRAGSDVLFRDPELRWQPVSSRLALEWRLPILIAAVAAAIAVGVGLVWASEPLDLVLVIAGCVALAAAVVGWVVVGRIVTSWHYAERAEDLLVTRGRLYRRLIVIPYGRMQVIEVSAGPLASWLGIATVVLVTASASTDARIPGLPLDEAHALRDRLAAKGEAMTAGI
jgi:membrane protein YdbS with pleckstrin-like domain